MNKEKVLILVPHADDETFGLSGFLQKYQEQYEIYIFCIGISHDATTRINRLSTLTSNISEFPHVNLLAFDVNYVLKYRYYFDELKELIIYNCDKLSLKPQKVLIPNKNDFHDDHKVINQLGKLIFRPNRNDFINEILEYKVPGSELYSSTFFDTELHLTDEQYNKKIELSNRYTTEIIPKFDNIEYFKTIFRKI